MLRVLHHCWFFWWYCFSYSQKLCPVVWYQQNLSRNCIEFQILFHLSQYPGGKSIFCCYNHNFANSSVSLLFLSLITQRQSFSWSSKPRLTSYLNCSLLTCGNRNSNFTFRWYLMHKFAMFSFTCCCCGHVWVLCGTELFGNYKDVRMLKTWWGL